MRHGNFQPVLDQSLHIFQDTTNEALPAPVTLEEVKQAVSKIAPTKAPDPGGLNSQLFQHHRAEFQQDIETFSRQVT